MTASSLSPWSPRTPASLLRSPSKLALPALPSTVSLVPLQPSPLPLPATTAAVSMPSGAHRAPD